MSGGWCASLASVNRRRLTLLLLVYISLDFANPLMPGAVQFDGGGAVDVVQADRARPQLATIAIDTSPAPEPVTMLRVNMQAVRQSSLRQSPSSSDILPRIWRTPFRSSDTPPSSEDH